MGRVKFTIGVMPRTTPDKKPAVPRIALTVLPLMRGASLPNVYAHVKVGGLCRGIDTHPCTLNNLADLWMHNLGVVLKQLVHPPFEDRCDQVQVGMENIWRNKWKKCVGGWSKSNPLE
eukprot:6214073-Pleurochrysis_carterae.AAC.3